MIRGMRNLFAHTYATMDKEIIWDVATNDIPYLLAFCTKYINEYNKNNQGIGDK